MKKALGSLRLVPASIWYLGFVTLLKNISSVLVVTFTPLFLGNVLGASLSTIGALEGIVEAFAFLVRIFSGMMSDIFRTRKGLIILGYTLGLVSRVFMALASSITAVFLSRALDRLGNGVQASPRDAMVADFSPKGLQGTCFGLRQTLTMGGSLIGAYLGILLARWTHNNYRLIFWLTIVPIVLGLLLLQFFVKDAIPPDKQKGPKGSLWLQMKAEVSLLPRCYWKVVFLTFWFMMCNYSASFLIIFADKNHMPKDLLPLILVAQSLMTTLTAYPFGRISDLLGRFPVFCFGVLATIFANVCLALATSYHFVLLLSLGVLLTGLQMGIAQSVFSAIISEKSPPLLRGTAFGIFHFVSGIAYLLSNIGLALLWEQGSSQLAFSAAAILGVLTLILAPFCMGRARR